MQYGLLALMAKVNLCTQHSYLVDLKGKIDDWLVIHDYGHRAYQKIPRLTID